jgi:hypothetical protein
LCATGPGFRGAIRRGGRLCDGRSTASGISDDAPITGATRAQAYILAILPTAPPTLAILSTGLRTPARVELGPEHIDRQHQAGMSGQPGSFGRRLLEGGPAFLTSIAWTLDLLTGLGPFFPRRGVERPRTPRGRAGASRGRAGIAHARTHARCGGSPSLPRPQLGQATVRAAAQRLPRRSWSSSAPGATSGQLGEAGDELPGDQARPGGRQARANCS